MHQYCVANLKLVKCLVDVINQTVNGDHGVLSSLTSAAQGGDALAEALMGSYCRVKHHYKQGIAWLEKSVAQGNAGGETSLGNAYAKGQGVPQN